MKQALYLLASTKIKVLNRTPQTCGGMGKGWALCWAVKGEDDAPDFDTIDEDDLPGELDAWGLSVVTVAYEGERAYAVDNRAATIAEVTAAMEDREGWRRE